MTLPEILLWEALRGRKLNGLFFRRQHAADPYIVDFYCASAKLSVEVDGAIHDVPGQADHDKRRDRRLANRGVQVLRIPAAEILNDETFPGVLEAIVRAAAPSTIASRWYPSPVSRGRSPVLDSQRAKNQNK